MLNEESDRACHPIIYVRGYAMTRGEQDETAAKAPGISGQLRFVAAKWNS